MIFGFGFSAGLGGLGLGGTGGGLLGTEAFSRRSGATSTKVLSLLGDGKLNRGADED